MRVTDLPGADTAITGAGTAVQKGATTAGTDIETSAGGIAGTAALGTRQAMPHKGGFLPSQGPFGNGRSRREGDIADFNGPMSLL
jgi:hypothetical protein